MDEAAVIARIKRNPSGTADLAEHFESTRSAVRRLLVDARARGMALHERAGVWHLDAAPALGTARDRVAELVAGKDGWLHFGAIGDTHLGSKYARLDCLQDYYDEAQARGIGVVMHAGNWIDGEASFNRHDLDVHGMDAQIRYLAENHPQRDGIETWAITGADHEGWYARTGGVDIGRYAANAMAEAGRTDWRDMGYMETYVRLKHPATGRSSMLCLMHPGGGSAYAISYAPQKIVEGFDGGDKPAVLLIGHYHKASYQLTRNVHTIQVGCFRGNTLIETDQGRKRICDIRVGDMVLTHRGRYRRVVETYSRRHDEGFIRLNYGRVGRPDQTITATPEHPILVERGGERFWTTIESVEAGDFVFVVGRTCPYTGERIPFWMNTAAAHNAMDRQDVRDKISATRGPKVWNRGGSPGETHMTRDVIPFCEEMQAQGWRIVPVGAGVIPDAVGFKDGRVVLFEVESHRGRLLEFKRAKYASAPITAFADDVEWVDIAQRAGRRAFGVDYEADTESPFVKVRVLNTEFVDQADHAKPWVTVHNFAVDEDNSYVAGRMVVHNCFQDQTVFMRQKKLSAHLGGMFVGVRLDPRTGAVIECQTTFRNYFVRDYYTGRWSQHGPTRNPPRKPAAPVSRVRPVAGPATKGKAR